MPLLFYRLPPIRDDEIRTPCRLIVAFAPPLFKPAALYERGIRTNDCHDVLSWLNPGAVEDRHVGVGRADDNIGAAHDLSRSIDWHEFGVHELRHARAEPLAIVGIAAKDFVGLDRAFVLQRENFVQRLAAAAVDTRHLGVPAHEVAEADGGGSSVAAGVTISAYDVSIMSLPPSGITTIGDQA